jgi:hypothetical protein
VKLKLELHHVRPEKSHVDSSSHLRDTRGVEMGRREKLRRGEARQVLQVGSARRVQGPPNEVPHGRRGVVGLVGRH